MTYKQSALFIILLIPFFLFFTSEACAQKDSVYVKKYNKILYYNSDSIFYEYATLGFEKTIDKIYYYYTEIVPFLDPEKQEEEIRKIESASEKYNSKNLRYEADFMDALFLPNSNEKEFEIKERQIQGVILSATKREDTSMKLRGMEALFDHYWSSMRYAKSFHQAHLLDDELQGVSETSFPRKNYIYCSIGKAYYFFQDYNAAIPYLRKVLVHPKYYFDTSNLEARNILGTYFNIIGETDSAEHYFRTALYSAEQVKDKLMFNALSLSNIGRCLARRKEYAKALTYFQPALSHMLADNNYALASGVTVNMGELYFAQNNLQETKYMIDSSRKYIKRGKNTDLYSELYFLMTKYYVQTGNAKQAAAYLDSAIVATRALEKKYNTLNILLAKQELFEMEKKVKDDNIRQNEIVYKNKLFYSSTVIVIVSLALVFLLILYRKNKRAYRTLVLKAQDWAEVSPKRQIDDDDPTDDEPADEATKEESEEEIYHETEEEKALTKKAHEFLVKDKTFQNIDLTLDFMAKELNVNRNQLSKAINRSAGKNFNTYINEYRVKEAIKMMSDKKMNRMSVDAIALEAGFGNRISFYQAFKKMTGLSPSDFRNNSKD
ncbi:helix-turn-helix domain-containing protein [Viscerimonas tarda]